MHDNMEQVAVTTERPWPATPRAETISVVEVVSARDSAGGMLNALLPLLPLRRRKRTGGAQVLAVTLRLLGSLLQSHSRNQEEMLRSYGMLLLGQLLRLISPVPPPSRGPAHACRLPSPPVGSCPSSSVHSPSAPPQPVAAGALQRRCRPGPRPAC